MAVAHIVSGKKNTTKMDKSKNIQVADLVNAMAQSEPCLFNNSESNLMPVTIKKLDIPLLNNEGDE